MIKKYMNEEVIFISPEEPLGKIVGKMKKNNIEQIPVIENEEYKGMVLLRNIISRTPPLKTEARNLLTHTPKVEITKNKEEAASLLLSSNVKALPVVEKGKIVGIISETDLIKDIKSNKKASEIAPKCITTDPKSTLGNIKKTMKQYNISRIPIVEDDKLIAIITPLNLIDFITGDLKHDEAKERPGKHDAVEKRTVESFKAENLIEKLNRDPVKVKRDKPIQEIAKILQDHEQVIVENKGFCIITPKDVLELIVSEPSKGIFVHITNLKDEDEITVDKLHQSAGDFVKKTEKLVKTPEFLIIHIERYQTKGKTKYSIRTRFSSASGLFVSKAWGWNLTTSCQKALGKLEKKIKKDHEKRKEYAEKRGRVLKEMRQKS